MELDEDLDFQSSDIKDDGIEGEEGEGGTPELMILEQAPTASNGVCRRRVTRAAEVEQSRTNRKVVSRLYICWELLRRWPLSGLMRDMDERPIARVTSSELLLPHLRVRSTFHADLLRPVRLNRRRTSGHPGGPPPASAACRKRRKHTKELRVIEESPPNNSKGPQNNPRASCFRRDGNLPRQWPEIRTGRSRDLCVRSQEMKGHHPQAIVIPSLGMTRTSGSTHHVKPDSCTSFTRSRDHQHHIPEPEPEASDPRWQVANTTRESGAYPDGDSRKIVRNKRVPGVHTHVRAGHSPGLSSVTEISQSREGLLRFHPATRQDLIRQDRHKGFQNQQDTNTMPDSQQTLKSFGGHKIVDPDRSRISLDVNFARPSPVHIQAGKSVVIHQGNTRSPTSKNGRTSDNVETPLPTTRGRTPPEDSPQSSIDRAIRPPSHVNTTRHHVSLCICEMCRRARSRRAPGPPPPPTFKIVGSEPRLVSATLQAHGFKKQSRRRAARGDWRLLWSSQHLRHHAFRNLNHNQRVNSFPRTYECTRKDALARNMNRMRQIHGEKHFSFAPRAFVLPAEREAIRKAMAGSDGAWIVKPASSACGRGIFITKNFADLPEGERLEGNWIVQSYVEDPLLMDGLKFDLRLYVAVTSFCPLRVYLHEEGLCRLATEPYSSEVRSFGNRFVHLTNYSINRKSSRYEPGTTTGLDIDGKETKCNNACPEGSETAGSKETVLTETSLSAVPPLRRAAAMATDLIATSNVEHTATSLKNDAATRFDIPEPVRGDASQEGDVAGGIDHPCRDHGRSEFHQSKKSASEGCDRGFPSSIPLDDVEKGGRGSKWNLAALRKRLAWMGFDVPALWEEIHELVIKTLIAIEGQVSAAVELMSIHRGVCFEMFGFDVLVDRKLKPYLLEVNFAPSLNTSSDLDLSVKSRVVADLLTLAGIRGAYGPKNSRAHFGRRVGRQVTRNGDRSIGEAGSGGEAVNGERVETRQTGESTAAIVSITAEGEDTETPIDGVDAPAFKVASDSDGNACVKCVTNAERRNEAGRASRRRRSRRTRKKIAGLSGEPGGSRRIAPAWDAHCGGGDSGLPSLEVSAVAAESARELRRSGGFRLIFPVRETAQKYFKFFDGPRPLERMLATAREEGASQSRVTPKGFSKNGMNSRRD